MEKMVVNGVIGFGFFWIEKNWGLVGVIYLHQVFIPIPPLLWALRFYSLL